MNDDSYKIDDPDQLNARLRHFDAAAVQMVIGEIDELYGQLVLDFSAPADNVQRINDGSSNLQIKIQHIAAVLNGNSRNFSKQALAQYRENFASICHDLGLGDLAKAPANQGSVGIVTRRP